MEWLEIKRAIKREWQLLAVNLQGIIFPFVFTLIMITLLQFALEGDARILLPRLYGLVLILVLFLVPDTLFKADWNSGYLHQYVFSSLGFLPAILLRLFFRGFAIGLPVVLTLFFASVILGVSAIVAKALLIGMSLVFLILFSLSALSAALTLTLPDSPLLNTLILMPFYCSPLMTLEMLISHAQIGSPFLSEIYLLTAFLLCLYAVIPLILNYLLCQSLR